MDQLTTPGVYINEINAFPNAVVPVPTAVPIFIGYTQKAPSQNTLIKLQSIADYEQYFGRGATPSFAIEPISAAAMMSILGKNYNLVNTAQTFYLYNSMRLFFQNGGNTCYVISIGSYSDNIILNAFTGALATLNNTVEGSMLVFPDALLLNKADYYTWVNDTLAYCNTAQNKISLIDVYGGNNPIPYGNAGNTVIDDLRSQTGSSGLNYGVAYYPWVQTSIVQSAEISFLNFSVDELTACLSVYPSPQVSTVLTQAKTIQQQYIAAGTPDALQQALVAAVNADYALQVISPDYASIRKIALNLMNALPVTPAMAGVYTLVDAEKGVFIASANVSLASVIDVCSKITDTTQATLNVDAVSGKSVNAIRFFNGQGVLVWGARTLDGNSQDWRYVNARRTMIMLEQSIKAAAQAYVFAPNDANTWTSVSAMISSFLTNFWKQGGLAGTKPSDAFTVSVGLGSTMTAADILDGYMNITVLVAITHPAEFLAITFQQQMQQS
jgi:phage tail sheath protein FI